MADKNNNKNDQPSGGGDDDQKKKGKNPASSSSPPPLKISEPSEEIPITTIPTSVTPPSVPVTTPPSDPAAPQPSSRRKKQPSTPSKGQGSSSRGVAAPPLAPVEERTCPICFVTFDSPQGMRGHSHNHTAEERAMHFGYPNKEEKRAKAKYDEWESTNRAIKAATESFTLNIPAKRAANVVNPTAMSSALTTKVRGSYSGISAEYGSGKQPRLHLNINEPPPMPRPPREEVEERNRNPRRRLLDFDVNEPPPRDDDDDVNDQEPPPT